MSQNNDQQPDSENNSADSANNKPLVEEQATAENVLENETSLADSHDSADDNEEVEVDTNEENNAVTENLTDEDFPEDFSDEDKESIKKVASDDNLSKAKSSASILVEQFIDAKETFNRSLGSLFTSAFTAGLEIGISFFVILAAFTLIGDFMPNKYAMVLASLLYPIGFIIVVIGQSLLFTEQTSLLSLPVLNKIEPLHKLLRLWGIVIAGNIVGGCIFAALMIGLGLNMNLFTVANIDAYAEHVLGFKWWVISAALYWQAG